MQNKGLRIATSARWYIGNMQTHDYLGVPYFSHHIRSLRDSTQSCLMWETP